MPRNNLRYRVNFGNGQAHYAGSKTDCVRFIGAYGDAYSFVEWQDPDTLEWFRTWRAKRRIKR
jgi:hypothetical protein